MSLLLQVAVSSEINVQYRLYHEYEPAFPEVASIFRASTLLDFPFFQDWSSQFLTNLWSDDLEQLSTERMEDPLEAVALGRTYGLSGVLKRAFYELLRTDGLGQAGLGGGGGEDEKKENANENVPMDTADTARLILAREKLCKAWGHTMTYPLNKGFPQCPNQTNNQSQAPKTSTTSATTEGSNSSATGCPSESDKKIEWTRIVHSSSSQDDDKDGGNKNRDDDKDGNKDGDEDGEDAKNISSLSLDYDHDVLCGLQALIDHDWENDGYCEYCVKVRRDAWQRQRIQLWDNLSSWLKI